MGRRWLCWIGAQFGLEFSCGIAWRVTASQTESPECARRRPSHPGSPESVSGATVAVFDQSRDDRGDAINLKLPVEPPAKDIHWPAVGVVARVADVLIVEGDFRRWGDGVAVVRLDDLFEIGMRPLPVADHNAQASGVEIGGVDAGYAVEE